MCVSAEPGSCLNGQGSMLIPTEGLGWDLCVRGPQISIKPLLCDSHCSLCFLREVLESSPRTGNCP